MPEPTYRQKMLARCMSFMQAGDPAYARHAASWYEANEPLDLHGLRARVDRDIERMSALSSPAPQSAKAAPVSAAPSAGTRTSARPRRP